MSKYVLVVGPSGVGKSTLCSIVAERTANLVHIDLDECAQIHCGGDYISRAKDYLHRLKLCDDGRCYLIDIGAGFQNNPDFLPILNANNIIIICIYSNSEIAYKRKSDRGGEWRNLKQYTNDEFSTYRKKIYRMGHKIDTSKMDTTKAIENFEELLKQSFG